MHTSINHNNIQCLKITFQGKIDLLKSGSKLLYRLKDPDSARQVHVVKHLKLILYYESCNTCTREYSNWKMCLCITYSILFIFFKARWKEEIIKRNWFIRSLRMLETKVCRFITVIKVFVYMHHDINITQVF